MTLIRSILILEAWLVGKNELKKFSLSKFGIKIPVAIKKEISNIAHARTERF
jgi:hypothetical protein